MKGADWIKVFEKKPLNELREIKSAIDVFDKDPDLNKAFKESGIFFGLPNLKYFVEDELWKKEGKIPYKERLKLLEAEDNKVQIMADDVMSPEEIDAEVTKYKINS